jgi:hypothetical protein
MQRFACPYESEGGSAPFGMIAAHPATNTRSPTRTAREYPTAVSYGEPDEMSRRST